MNTEDHSTLGELLNIEGLDDALEYIQGLEDEPDTRMTRMRIQNPENHQWSMTAWVPTALASQLALELINAERSDQVQRYGN